MIGADVAVVWIDNKGRGNAQDYILKDKSQCSGKDGSCPDTRIAVRIQKNLLFFNKSLSKILFLFTPAKHKLHSFAERCNGSWLLYRNISATIKSNR